MQALQFLSFIYYSLPYTYTIFLFFMKIYIFSDTPRIDFKLSRNLSQLQNLCFLRAPGENELNEKKIVYLTFEGCGISLAREADHFSFAHGCRLWECREHWALGLLVWYQNVERARREALAGIVECLARVRASVLREDLGDIELVNICLVRVLEVLARLDFLVVMKPNDVELLSADYSTAQ